MERQLWPSIRIHNKNPAAAAQSRMMLIMVAVFALMLIGQFFLYQEQAQEPPPSLQPRRQQTANGIAAAATRASSLRRSPRAPTAPAAAPAQGGHRPNRNGGRERSLPHRLHQQGRAGQVVGAEEVQGRQGPTARPGQSRSRSSYGLPLSLYTYDDSAAQQDQLRVCTSRNAQGHDRGSRRADL